MEIFSNEYKLEILFDNIEKIFDVNSYFEFKKISAIKGKISLKLKFFVKQKRIFFMGIYVLKIKTMHNFYCI